jgi:type IV secretory pathway VirB10-like protein
MSKLNSTKLQLKATLPKALQVNKPIVIVLSALIAFIVIFSIISAFNVSQPNKTAEQRNGASTLGATVDKTGAFSSSLKNLPEGYQDVAGIKRFASEGGGNKLVTELQKDIESLKQQDATLQQEVAKLLQHPQVAPQDNNPQTQQAKSAGIFFGGIAPGSAADSAGVFKSGGDGSSTSSGIPGASGMGGTIGGSGSSVVPTATDLQVQKLPPAAQSAFYNKQSMLQQKIAVLKATDNPEDIYDLHNMTQPASPYEVQAGSIIPAVLITGVNTSLAGTVVAQSRFNIYDSMTGKYLLIPRGSRIIGEYDARVSYGQRRVLLTFTRIIRPDGSSILIGKPTSADIQGAAGMDGKVDNHWGKILAAATLSTILSVGAGVVSDNSGSDNVNYRSSKQNAMLGASSSISQIGANIANRALDIQPTITLNSGYQFNIIVRRDMVLSPYQPME